MDKWIAIAILTFMLVSYAFVNTLTMFKLQRQVEQVTVHRQIAELQEHVKLLQSDVKHHLHRLNALDYWEVLPPKGKRKVR